MKKAIAIGWLLLIIVISVGYPELVERAWPYHGFKFQSGWEDSSFEAQYGDIAWIDSNFTQGWKVVWISRSSQGAQFTTENGFGVLSANFSGYNYADEKGLTGIMIQKFVGKIDTVTYPYLTINHMETAYDFSMSFSFGVIDERGTLHEGGLHHVSASAENLKVDLRRLFNGTINLLSVRFANDYDPNYDGGTQKSYLKQIVISGSTPQWMLSFNKPVNASISSEKSIMEVRAMGNLTVDTIVTAQRLIYVSLDLERYSHFRILIKTSSIEVAARIVIWTDLSRQYVILTKTYNDANWHTEIVDLGFFGIDSQHLYLIELGFSQVLKGAESSVCYQQLSFNSLEV